MDTKPHLSRADLIRETFVSAAINAAFSAGFMFLVFGGESYISLRGSRSLLGDSFPQSFTIVLMASFVPQLLLVRNLPPMRGNMTSILSRSLGLAFCVATVAWVALSMAMPEGALSFRTAAIVKIVYGAVLGALVTAISLTRWGSYKF